MTTEPRPLIVLPDGRPGLDLSLWFRARLANAERRLDAQVARVLAARGDELRRSDAESARHEWWVGIYGVGHGARAGVVRMDDAPGEYDPSPSGMDVDNRRTL